MLYWHYRHSIKDGGEEEVMRVMDVWQLGMNPFCRLVYRRIMLSSESLSSKFHRCPRSFAFLPNVKFFGQSFSLGHFCPIQEQAGKGFIYFITLRMISQSEHTKTVPAHFVDFFVFFVLNCKPTIHFSVTSFCKKYSFVFHNGLKV